MTAAHAVKAAIHAELGDERCQHDALGDDCGYLAQAALRAAVSAIADALNAQYRLPFAMQRIVREDDIQIIREVSQ